MAADFGQGFSLRKKRLPEPIPAQRNRLGKMFACSPDIILHRIKVVTEADERFGGFRIELGRPPINRPGLLQGWAALDFGEALLERSCGFHDRGLRGLLLRRSFCSINFFIWRAFLSGGLAPA